MKLVNFISGFALLLLVGCTAKDKTTETTFSFNWGSPQHLEVVEIASKKAGEMELIHHGEFVKTNGGFLLQWRNPTITEINGEKVDSSKEWPEAAALLGKSMAYPSFRISDSGEFLEAINLEEAVAKVNQMVDAAATNRPEESRKFLTDMAKSEAGKAYLNQIYGVVWQTWVAAWTDVNLTNGESQSISGTVEFAGVEMPVTDKITNLGSTTSDPNIVTLKYEQDLSGTNLLSGLNNFVQKMSSDTEIKGAGPITNECSIRRVTILEVQTERQTLRPHWAKRTTKTNVSAPGEQETTELETREYRFQWGGTNITGLAKQP